MPTYCFRNKQTDEEFEVDLRMDEREQYLKDHPELEQFIGHPNSFIDPIKAGYTKPDEGFRDILREYKKRHRHNTINVI